MRRSWDTHETLKRNFHETLMRSFMKSPHVKHPCDSIFLQTLVLVKMVETNWPWQVSWESQSQNWVIQSPVTKVSRDISWEQMLRCLYILQILRCLRKRTYFLNFLRGVLPPRGIVIAKNPDLKPNNQHFAEQTICNKWCLIYRAGQ